MNGWMEGWIFLYFTFDFPFFVIIQTGRLGGKMLWTVSWFFFVGFFLDSASAGKQCRQERSISGMALRGFVFKTFSVTAAHECDISCKREIICQSYNYVMEEKICELISRTKEEEPDNLYSDPERFYVTRLVHRGIYQTFCKSLLLPVSLRI